MDDQKHDGRFAAADETEGMVHVDKATDDELSDDEMSTATGGLRSYAKEPDEDAGPDGRITIR